MRTPIPDYLDSLLSACAGVDSGEVASYIPELGKADPSWFGVALCTVDGNVYSAGDDAVRFTIQSISKPFAYAMALAEHGLRRVLEIVDVEPSGEAFDEISLDRTTKRPLNPMINAGAIAVNQLVLGEDAVVAERVEYMRAFLSRVAGRELSVNHDVERSELDHADRNMALAHMLRSHGVIRDSALDAVAGYIAVCSIEVDVRDLAVMAATLANGGVQPVTGERLMAPEVARQVQAVMASAGMYDAAGHWMTTVGIPAKSGVSGGMLGTLPGQLGIATFSPLLDRKGNSVRGTQVFRTLSAEMGLHLMASEPHGTETVRTLREENGETLLRLQGYVNFVAAERFVRQLSEHTFTTTRILVDVSRVTAFNKVGRTIAIEAMRRMLSDGLNVVLFDPDGVLSEQAHRAPGMESLERATESL